MSKLHQNRLSSSVVNAVQTNGDYQTSNLESVYSKIKSNIFLLTGENWMLQQNQQKTKQKQQSLSKIVKIKNKE